MLELIEMLPVIPVVSSEPSQDETPETPVPMSCVMNFRVELVAYEAMKSLRLTSVYV